MRLRLRTLMIAVLMLSMLAAPAGPASALVDVRRVGAVAVFAGTATVAGNIGYPVCTDGTTPPNLPLVPCPSASGQTWSFSANSANLAEAAAGLTCGILTTTNLPGPPTDITTKWFCTAGGGSSGAQVTGASITASGTLTNGVLGASGGAWCGASGGTGGTSSGGLGTATVSGPNVEVGGGLTATRNLTINSIGWIQSAGTLIVAMGTATSDAYTPNPTGPIVTVVSAIPDPTTGTSCTNRTQTLFRVVGTAVAALTS